MHIFLKTVFYLPLYNALIFFISVLPLHNVGLAVILFTCFIKIILFPFSQKAAKNQMDMKSLEKDIALIKEQYKDDKKTQAEKTMALYKDKGVNPFSGILLMLIQLPILMTLYYIFIHAGFPNINHLNLYSFTKFPEAAVSMNFLGINVASHSNIFALLAALAQFFQVKLTLPAAPKKEKNSKATFGEELSRSMSVQMKYVMPAVIFLIARSFPAVVSLYLVTSSVFAIGQELYIQRKKTVTV